MRIPSPSSRSGKRAYLTLFDLIWASASPIVALALRDLDLFQSSDWHVFGYFWLCSTGFALLAFFAFRLQDGMTDHFSAHDAFDVLEAVLFTELMTFLALFTMTRLDGIPRSIPLTHGLLLFAGLIAARIFARVILAGDEPAPDYRCRRDRIIVIGANRLAGSFIKMLQAFSPEHQSVVAVLDERSGFNGRAISGVRVMGAPHELDALISEFAIHGVKIDRVVIAGEGSLVSAPTLHEIEHICKRRHIDISYLPRMMGVTERRAPAMATAAAPDSAQALFPVRPYFKFKRWIDVAGCCVIATLLSPILLVAGVLVLFDVGRPLLFWQERSGWKGRSFLIYKFRTLRAPFTADGGQTATTDRQPSAIGQFLRGTRIDELPQLLNVLLGDMSLIGPRPLLPEDQPSNTLLRLSVRPGLTGWAQVNGGKLVSKEEKEKLDEWYVRNATIWVDLMIVLMTIKMMMSQSPQESQADAQQIQLKRLSPMVTTIEPDRAALVAPAVRTLSAEGRR